MVDRTGFLLSGAPCRDKGGVRNLRKSRGAVKRSSRGALMADPDRVPTVTYSVQGQET